MEKYGHLRDSLEIDMSIAKNDLFVIEGNLALVSKAEEGLEAKYFYFFAKAFRLPQRRAGRIGRHRPQNSR